MKLKNTALAIIALAVTSCAGITGSISTPYGDAYTDAKGRIVVAPKPIVIPDK